MARFKTEKQSGRSGYWRVLDTATGVYVEEYIGHRDTARDWQKTYERGDLDYALAERNLPTVNKPK